MVFNPPIDSLIMMILSLLSIRDLWIVFTVPAGLMVVFTVPSGSMNCVHRPYGTDWFCLQFLIDSSFYGIDRTLIIYHIYGTDMLLWLCKCVYLTLIITIMILNHKFSSQHINFHWFWVIYCFFPLILSFDYPIII